MLWEQDLDEGLEILLLSLPLLIVLLRFFFSMSDEDITLDPFGKGRDVKTPH